MSRKPLLSESNVRVAVKIRPGKKATFKGEAIASMDLDAEMPPGEAHVIYRLLAFGDAETFRKVLAILDSIEEAARG